MNKKIFFPLALLSSLVTFNLYASEPVMQHNGMQMQQHTNMQNPRFVPIEKAQILQKGEQKNYCPVCGMALNHFYKTNHAAVDHAGHDKQYCSIHCAVEDNEINKNKLSNFKVVDNDTLKFIDSQKAYFVVGSSQPGTMSGISKYGFSSKESAQKFADQFGGEIMQFDALYAMVKSNLASEIEAVKEKQAKAAKKGGKLYKKMCRPIDEKFTSAAQAKTYIEKHQSCENMNTKQLHMVSLYLSSQK